MKKLTAILLAIVLALSICAFATEEITGAWYASMYGITMTLNVNEDGTCSISMGEMVDEETDIATWKLDGDKFIIEPGTDNETVATFDGEKITMTEDGEAIEFTREEPVAFVAAAVRTDAAIEDFAGDWVCTLVEMFGMQVEPAVAEMDVTLNIDGTNVTMAVIGMGSDEPFTAEATLTDGAMAVLGESDDLGVTYTIYALEDGTLRVSMTLMDQEVNFYMAAA